MAATLPGFFREVLGIQTPDRTLVQHKWVIHRVISLASRQGLSCSAIRPDGRQQKLEWAQLPSLPTPFQNRHLGSLWKGYPSKAWAFTHAVSPFVCSAPSSLPVLQGELPSADLMSLQAHIFQPLRRIRVIYTSCVHRVPTLLSLLPTFKNINILLWKILDMHKVVQNNNPQ